MIGGSLVTWIMIMTMKSKSRRELDCDDDADDAATTITIPIRKFTRTICHILPIILSSSLFFFCGRLPTHQTKYIFLPVLYSLFCSLTLARPITTTTWHDMTRPIGFTTVRWWYIMILLWHYKALHIIILRLLYYFMICYDNMISTGSSHDSTTDMQFPCPHHTGILYTTHYTHLW